MLQPGLYEQVINHSLRQALSEIPEDRKATAPIDKAEASKVLTQYITDIIQHGFDQVSDKTDGLSAQVKLVNQIVALVQNTVQEKNAAALTIDKQAEQLLALLKEKDPLLAAGKTASDLERPEQSLYRRHS